MQARKGRNAFHSMNQEEINNQLKQEELTEFHKGLLTEIKGMLKASSSKMSTYWDGWENADKSYRGYKVYDKEDEKSAAKGEPHKILLPLTFAQLQTAASFIFSTFTQKERFFELSGTSSEDVKYSEAMETDLAYQTNKDKLTSKVYAFVLDNLKYGIAVAKVTWDRETCKLRVANQVPQPTPLQNVGAFFGLPVQPKMVTQETVADVLMYEGNRIKNISPYCFLPDPELPVARFQEGSFCAYEEIVAKDKIKKLEGQEYFGTKYVTDIKKDVTENEERRRWWKLLDKDETLTSSDTKIDRSAWVFTEIQLNINPKEYKEKFDVDLGPEDYPIKFVAVVINDSRIVSFRPLGYLHNNFTYVVSEFLPDHNEFLSQGLTDCIAELQNLATWFANSRVANVKKVIKNQLLVKPEEVFIEDIVDNQPYIRIKSKVGASLESSIKQLNVTDVTSSHINDMKMVIDLMQQVTGVNDNAIGQYASGRRSAFESRQVNAGAAMRLKMHATLQWMNGIEPLAQMMLANTRQNRTKEAYNEIVGANLAQTAPFEKVILADPNRIAGGYDFVPYDGTLPSEKNSQAQILQELLTTIIANPMVAQATGIQIKPLLARIGELTGMKDLDNLVVDPPFNQMPMPVGVPGVPTPGGLPPTGGPPPVEVMQPGAQPPPGAVPMSGTALLNALSGGAQ